MKKLPVTAENLSTQPKVIEAAFERYNARQSTYWIIVLILTIGPAIPATVILMLHLTHVILH